VVAGPAFVLADMIVELLRQLIEILIELGFELANSRALFVERPLRLGSPFFEPAREGGLPLGGGGDFQSLVVHGVHRACRGSVRAGDSSRAAGCLQRAARLRGKGPRCNR
jgi:hypothetical protein